MPVMGIHMIQVIVVNNARIYVMVVLHQLIIVLNAVWIDKIYLNVYAKRVIMIIMEYVLNVIIDVKRAMIVYNVLHALLIE